MTPKGPLVEIICAKQPVNGKNLHLQLQEVIYESPDTVLPRKISRLEKAGTRKKIALRIYTTNLTDDPESIVRRNLFSILGHQYAGAVLSHCSALEFKPTSTGQIFLTYM